MVSRPWATGLSLALALVASAPAPAQQHDTHNAPAAHANPPAAHANPQPAHANPPAIHYQPAPATHYQPVPATHYQPAPTTHYQSAPAHYQPRNDSGTYHRPISVRPGNGVVTFAPSGSAPQFHYLPGRMYPGPVVRNPHWGGHPWHWHHDIVWFPTPDYWGGGFWGPFAFGIPIVVYGEYPYDGDDYQSYAVAPDSPGAQLLQQYNLTQTQCGPPNLVVIWGPDDSVICAYPNDLVAPGQYTVDPSTLSLVLATGD